MTPEFWDEAAKFGYYTADAGATVFILIYMLLAKWWKTPMGRHLFSFMLVIALVLNHGLVAISWDAYRASIWFNIVRAGLYWAVAAVIIWRVVILVHVQLQKRRGDGAGKSGTTEGSSRWSHPHMDGADGTHHSLVERIHPVGGDHERVGQRRRPLLWVPGRTSRGQQWPGITWY